VYDPDDNDIVEKIRPPPPPPAALSAPPPPPPPTIKTWALIVEGEVRVNVVLPVEVNL
jgi:hypothetical protein